jgi:ABC-2 type transport system ATP-binding protein
MPIIEIEGLEKTYYGMFGKSVPALCGVDLKVERGQAFGLLGPNGAGKTTLVKVLLGLVRKTAGSARLLGYPAGSATSRLRVGYMPEHRHYPAFLKARQVLDVFGQLNGLPASRRKERIGIVLEDVEMSNWADHKVGGFSKGMRQRLALAQALLNEPELLFLDEPAEGIDPLGRVVVRNILRRCQERGTTLFINSHLLTEVEMVCDQVAILHAGRVAESGPLAGMTSKEREYRLIAATEPEHVIVALEGAVESFEEVKAPAGLFAWRLTVGSRAQLNSAVDRLRAGGVEIEAIEAVRSSLEDVFLQAVESASDASPAEDQP